MVNARISNVLHEAMGKNLLPSDQNALKCVIHVSRTIDQQIYTFERSTWEAVRAAAQFSHREEILQSGLQGVSQKCMGYHKDCFNLFVNDWIIQCGYDNGVGRTYNSGLRENQKNVQTGTSQGNSRIATASLNTRIDNSNQLQQLSADEVTKILSPVDSHHSNMQYRRQFRGVQHFTNQLSSNVLDPSKELYNHQLSNMIQNSSDHVINQLPSPIVQNPSGQLYRLQTSSRVPDIPNSIVQHPSRQLTQQSHIVHNPSRQLPQQSLILQNLPNQQVRQKQPSIAQHPSSQLNNNQQVSPIAQSYHQPNISIVSSKQFSNPNLTTAIQNPSTLSYNQRLSAQAPPRQVYHYQPPVVQQNHENSRYNQYPNRSLPIPSFDQFAKTFSSITDILNDTAQFNRLRNDSGLLRNNSGILPGQATQNHCTVVNHINNLQPSILPSNATTNLVNPNPIQLSIRENILTSTNLTNESYQSLSTQVVNSAASTTHRETSFGNQNNLNVVPATSPPPEILPVHKKYSLPERSQISHNDKRSGNVYANNLGSHLENNTNMTKQMTFSNSCLNPYSLQSYNESTSTPAIQNENVRTISSHIISQLPSSSQITMAPRVSCVVSTVSSSNRSASDLVMQGVTTSTSINDVDSDNCLTDQSSTAALDDISKNQNKYRINIEEYLSEIFSPVEIALMSEINQMNGKKEEEKHVQTNKLNMLHNFKTKISDEVINRRKELLEKHPDGTFADLENVEKQVYLYVVPRIEKVKRHFEKKLAKETSISIDKPDPSSATESSEKVDQNNINSSVNEPISSGAPSLVATLLKSNSRTKDICRTEKTISLSPQTESKKSDKENLIVEVPLLSNVEKKVSHGKEGVKSCEQSDINITATVEVVESGFQANEFQQDNVSIREERKNDIARKDKQLFNPHSIVKTKDLEKEKLPLFDFIIDEETEKSVKEKSQSEISYPDISGMCNDISGTVIHDNDNFLFVLKDDKVQLIAKDSTLSRTLSRTLIKSKENHGSFANKSDLDVPAKEKELDKNLKSSDGKDNEKDTVVQTLETKSKKKKRKRHSDDRFNPKNAYLLTEYEAAVANDDLAHLRTLLPAGVAEKDTCCSKQISKESFDNPRSPFTHHVEQFSNFINNQNSLTPKDPTTSQESVNSIETDVETCNNINFYKNLQLPIVELVDFRMETDDVIIKKNEPAIPSVPSVPSAESSFLEENLPDRVKSRERISKRENILDVLRGKVLTIPLEKTIIEPRQITDKPKYRSKKIRILYGKKCFELKRKDLCKIDMHPCVVVEDYFDTLSYKDRRCYTKTLKRNSGLNFPTNSTNIVEPPPLFNKDKLNTLRKICNSVSKS